MRETGGLIKATETSGTFGTARTAERPVTWSMTTKGAAQTPVEFASPCYLRWRGTISGSHFKPSKARTKCWVWAFERNPSCDCSGMVRAPSIG
jgi:hypothetical protein